MNVVVIANFDIKTNPLTIDFPHDGTWYDYFSGVEIQVSDYKYTRDFLPGDYALYTDVKIETDLQLSNKDAISSNGTALYPNPNNGDRVYIAGANVVSVELVSLTGQIIKISSISNNSFDVSGLAKGVYIAKINRGNKVDVQRLILE
jgi:hypothetical protein